MLDDVVGKMLEGRGQRPQTDPDSHHLAQTQWNLFDFIRMVLKQETKNEEGGGKSLWKERKSMLKCVKRWRRGKSLDIKCSSKSELCFLSKM